MLVLTEVSVNEVYVFASENEIAVLNSIRGLFLPQNDMKRLISPAHSPSAFTPQVNKISTVTWQMYGKHEQLRDPVISELLISGGFLLIK